MSTECYGITLVASIIYKLFLGINPLVLPLQVGVAVISEGLRWVVKSHLLIHLSNLLQILLIKLKVAFQVGLYASWSLGLWQDTASLSDTPCERDLGTSLSILLSDFGKNWLIDELRKLLSLVVNLVRVSEWGVLGDVDALLSVPCDKVLLLQVWVQLDLVSSWDDLALLEHSLDLLLGEVGDTNCLSLSGLNHLLHSLVSLDIVDILSDHLSGVVLLEELVRGLECSWPVDQVEIDVVESKVLQGSIEGWLDGGWSVGVVPELSGDEELLAWDLGLGDGTADGWLGAVDAGSVNVSVLWELLTYGPRLEMRRITYTSLQGLKNGLLLGADILPRAKSQCWDLGASVELLVSLSRHFVSLRI